MVGIVTRDARSTAGEIQDQLESRDIQGLALLSLGAAAGVVVASRLSKFILRTLDMGDADGDPQTPGEFGLAAGVKLAGALAVGMVAANVGGLGMVVLAFVAVGHLVFAGADIINAVLGGAPAATTAGGGIPTSSATPTASASGSASKASADGGYDY